MSSVWCDGPLGGVASSPALRSSDMHGACLVLPTPLVAKPANRPWQNG